MFDRPKVATRKVLTKKTHAIRRLIEQGWHIESATWGWTILSKGGR